MALFREFVAAQLQELGNRLAAEHERLLPHDRAWPGELELEKARCAAAESALQQAEQELRQLRAEKSKILAAMGFAVSATPGSAQLPMLSLENGKVGNTGSTAAGVSVIGIPTDHSSTPGSSQTSSGQRAPGADVTPPLTPRSTAMSQSGRPMLPPPHSPAAGSLIHSPSQPASTARAPRPTLQLDAAPQRNQRRSQTWDKRPVTAIPEERQSEQKLLAPKPPNLLRLTSDEKRRATPMKALQKRRNSAPTLVPMPERPSEDGLSDAGSLPAPKPSPSMASSGSRATSNYTLGQLGPQVKLGGSHSAGGSEMSAPMQIHVRSNSFSSKVSKEASILGVTPEEYGLTPEDSISEYDGSPRASAHKFKRLGWWEEREVSYAIRPSTLSSFSLFQPIDYNADSDESGCCSCWIMRTLVVSPSAVKRSFWDFASLAFVVYDAIVIPLQFIRFPRNPGMSTFSWLSRLFWTFDIPASFLTGFALRNGSVEVRPSKIARRYMRTWWLLDTIMVVSDWLEVLISSDGDVLQLVQMLRMFRLLRLTRIQRVLDLVIDRAGSEKVGVMVSLLRSLSGIVLITHVMACCWVGLGNLGTQGWVSQRGITDERWEQYAIGFHWSLTQFYGAMELEPSTLGERFYAIGSLLAGFVLATAFVSNITSSMTRLYIITSQQTGQFKVLSRYLKEHGISRKLASRVQRNAQHTLEEQQRNVPEDDVELLKFVSAPLRVELHFEIYAPLLFTHPLLKRLQDSSAAVMRQICHTAVSVMTLSRDDILFSRGEVPARPAMLFVCSGSLVYSQDGERFQEVLPGEWICEHVLWTSWVYHGLLYAREACRLAVLDAQTFCEVVSKCPTTTAELSSYAEQFLQLVNNSPNTRSDLGSSMDIDSLMVLSFPRASAEDAPGFAAFGGSWWPRRFSKSQIFPVASLTSVAVTG